MNKHTNNNLYETALRGQPGLLARFLYKSWIVLGLSALVMLSWSEPWTAQLFTFLSQSGWPVWLTDFAGPALVMILRAVLFVEAVGYVYHRFFQHVGFLTRQHHVFRRNQKFHWIHHMIIYPIGRFYKRKGKYLAAEKGLSLSWALPAIAAVVLFLLFHGITFASVAFVVAMAVYIKYVVDLSHARFHLAEHPWTESGYFQWLEKIHILHHWDQRKNFTIVHPLMDMLFGTYLSPAGHEKEIDLAIEDEELTVSDLINWRYLLVEASPAEYAAFVSTAKQHPRSIRKVSKMLDVFESRMEVVPQDAEARELHKRSLDLLAACGKSRVK